MSRRESAMALHQHDRDHIRAGRDEIATHPIGPGRWWR
jgi:hypothetical protein